MHDSSLLGTRPYRTYITRRVRAGTALINAAGNGPKRGKWPEKRGKWPETKWSCRVPARVLGHDGVDMGGDLLERGVGLGAGLGAY